MAQIIKHRRGTLANLSSVTLNNGEIGVVTSSVQNIGDAALKTALVVGHTDGTNRLSVSRLSYGTAVPNLGGITGGANFNDLIHYDSDNYKLYRLNTGGNTDLDLTGAIAGRALSGSLIVTGVADFESDIEAQSNIDLSGSLFLEDATAAITHQGATGLAISSTSGYVDVESVRFTGTNIGINGDTDLIVPTANTLTVNATTFTLDDNAVVGIDSDTDLMQLASNSVNVRGAISASSFISASALHVEGNVDVEGNITIGGTLQIGDSATDSVSFSADVTSDIIPNASDSYDLGSDSQRWNDLYLSGSISASGGNHSILSAGTIDIDAEGALTLDGGSITIGGDSDVAFDIDTSTLDIDSSGAITIDGTSTFSVDVDGATNINTSVGNITVDSEAGNLVLDGHTGVDIDASNSGKVSIDGAGGIDIGVAADVAIDVDSSTFDLDASGALTIDSATSIAIGANADKPIDIDSTTLDIDASDAVTIDSTSTILISGDGGATFSDDTEAIIYDGSGNLDIDSVALDIDASGALTIDSATSIGIGTAADKPIDIDATTFDVDASGALTMTSTTMAFDPSSTFDIDAAGAVTIDGSSITLGGDSDVAFDIDTSTLDIDSSGAITIDSTAGVSVQGGAASDVTTGAGALTLDGAGGVNIAGNAAEIDITTSAALDLNSGAFTLNGSTVGIDGTGALTLGASEMDIDADGGVINMDATSTITIGGTNATGVTIGKSDTTVTIPGSLDVNGTLTTIDTTNLKVADRFILMASGSSAGDGGIVVETNGAGSGTALGYDDSASRWALTKQDDTSQSSTTITPRQYVVSVSGSAADPSGNPSDFGSAAGDRIGMMHVNTSTGDIFIFS
jgi:hypothetical protein